jgi:hypothetical protein
MWWLRRLGSWGSCWGSRNKALDCPLFHHQRNEPESLRLVKITFVATAYFLLAVTALMKVMP